MTRRRPAPRPNRAAQRRRAAAFQMVWLWVGCLPVIVQFAYAIGAAGF